jgi:hypothetical protein
MIVKAEVTKRVMIWLIYLNMTLRWLKYARSRPEVSEMSALGDNEVAVVGLSRSLGKFKIAE